MNKQAPSTAKLLSMVAFTASCIGLLLFLWISFGGTLPFAAQGYRLNAEFADAVQLGAQSDVRISGVNVGKVVSVSLDRRTGLTKAVMQLDHQYAPRPLDTRAILRAKSLLGETYVELTPGTASAPKLPDGATLPRGQIAPTVQLDQILSTFDPATRHAFQVWMRQGAIALTNRGEEFNTAIANLYPFAVNVDAVLSVLNRDSAATTALLHNGGQVFSAIARSPAQLQGFITNSNTVFAATAAQDTALARTVQLFPAYLISTRVTIDRLTRFADTTTPLVDELLPAATPLSQALQASVGLAPELRALMVNIGPLSTAARTGVPALERFLNDSVPWLTRLTPYLGNFVPVINYVNVYRREIAAFFANSTATTQAVSQNITTTGLLHYLRISNPVNPETLSSYQTRLESNRGNPYLTPGGYGTLLTGLQVFGGYLCTRNAQPTIGPSIPATLAELLSSVYYTANSGGPACRAQPPLGTTTTGQLTSYPHLNPLP